MISLKSLKYQRHPKSRYGCDRSRRVVDRFSHNPEKVDRIARLVIEAGSTLRAGKAVRHV
ncbi:hypothetical protein [Brucella sp.]|uniref:hypothetical protein n=1 Tax=Brucella sp. TaxID=52132 RepID=UPI0028AB67AF|nr:hypothetical protein [Brucella sp.]